MTHGEVLRGYAEIGAASQQGCCQRGLGVLRLTVSDIEYRRHFVAVLGLKAAARETDLLDHVGIDDGEPFLLAAADK